MAVELTVEPTVRGLLKSDIRDGERILRWFEPAEPLVPFVQRIWSAEWKIPPGESRTQPILPYPSANFAIAGGQAMVIGVVTPAQPSNDLKAPAMRSVRSCNLVRFEPSASSDHLRFATYRSPLKRFCEATIAKGIPSSQRHGYGPLKHISWRKIPDTT